MKQALIITNFVPGSASAHQQALEKFCLDFNKLSPAIKLAYCSLQELIFRVDGNKTSILLEGRELHEHYALISLRNMTGYVDYVSALSLYAKHYGIKVINERDSDLPLYGKVSQGFAFAQNNLPTPPLCSSPNNATLLQWLGSQAPQTFPLIVKHNDGIKGLHNYLVHDRAELKAVLAADKQGFVVQPYIDNEGEIRVLAFGKRPPIIFKKTAGAGTHLNNTSQGGEAVELTRADLGPEILQLSDAAIELTGREFGGVDILLSKDGRRYILEVNHSPALFTGTLYPQKVQAFYDFIQTELGEK